MPPLVSGGWGGGGAPARGGGVGDSEAVEKTIKTAARRALATEGPVTRAASNAALKKAAPSAKDHKPKGARKKRQHVPPVMPLMGKPGANCTAPPRKSRVPKRGQARRATKAAQAAAKNVNEKYSAHP